MAPEMMQSREYGTSVDWFSFGLLLYEMLSGKNPFREPNGQPTDFENLGEKINELLGKEHELIREDASFSPEAKDLLSKLLKYDPNERIGCQEGGSVDEIKEHPFFRDVEWDLIL